MATQHAVAVAVVPDSGPTLREHLLAEGLPEPDELRTDEDGGLVCVWHGRAVALSFDLEDP